MKRRNWRARPGPPHIPPVRRPYTPALANGAFVARDTQSAPINGSFSLIKDMTMSSAGKKLYEARGVNKVLFIKTLVQYSDDFARTVGQDEFWYLDTDNTTVTADAATNKGIRGHALLLQGDPIKTVKTVIPLNCYSFFEELSDRLLPQKQLLFDIVLEDDSEMIFQNGATGRRIVVTIMQLWVSKLMLTPGGQKAVNEQFLKPTKWRYLKQWRPAAVEEMREVNGKSPPA